MPDDPVVARAKDGDPYAWRELYRSHAGRLVAWLHTRPTGDPSVSAEDIAAEAWQVAASKTADFHGSASDFAGWLFNIARHINDNTVRRSQRRRTDPGDVHEELPPGPDSTAVLDGRDWVRNAISSLPPRERDVVGLVDGLGLDTRTAAEALAISQTAVRTARHRGLRRLRRTLARADVTIGGPGDM